MRVFMSVRSTLSGLKKTHTKPSKVKTPYVCHVINILLVEIPVKKSTEMFYISQHYLRFT
jgi:hypothetical protein